jgi:hypothetical protein
MADSTTTAPAPETTAAPSSPKATSPATGTVVASSAPVPGQGTGGPTPTNPLDAAVAAQTMAESITARLQKNLSATDFGDLLADIQRYGTGSLKNLVVFMTAYVAAMAPGRPITAIEGVRQQYGLWGQLRILLEQIPGEEFRDAWTLLLRFAYQQKAGVFKETHLFRFADQWSWSRDEQQGFYNLLTLAKKTAEPGKLREGLKSIDLGKAIAVGLSDTAKQRLTAYYK